MLIGELRDRGVTSAIAVGGAHIGADQNSSRLVGADTYFMGEAEEEFTKYCKTGVNGEYTRDFIRCQSTSSLDSLKHPARHLFKKGYMFTPVLTSRGCPFSCIYCSMAAHPYRKRGVEGLRKEIKEIVGSGCKSVDIADDVFTLDRVHAIEVSNLLDEAGLSWHASTRADLVDSEMIKHMAACGCTHLSFGVESGSQKIRYSTGKRISDDAILNAFKWCKEYSIETRAYAMIGFPGEVGQDIQKTFDFIHSIDPDDVFYSPTITYPSTKLMEIAVTEGKLPADAWSKYTVGEAPMPYYIPDGLSLEYIKEICVSESERFYLNPKQIIRRLRYASGLDDIIECLFAATAYLMQPDNRKR
jgi:anaerobic magnesium-protoporphyrin IX monomethyl ester cyclase